MLICYRYIYIYIYTSMHLQYIFWFSWRDLQSLSVKPLPQESRGSRMRGLGGEGVKQAFALNGPFFVYLAFRSFKTPPTPPKPVEIVEGLGTSIFENMEKNLEADKATGNKWHRVAMQEKNTLDSGCVASKCTQIHIYANTHINIYIYIYVYI